MAELIVLTCAAGKQSSHLVPLLYDNSAYHLRLVAHSEKSVARLQETYPKAEVVQADLVNISDCSKVVQGATVVYHINPSFHPRETDIGKNMVDASQAEARKSESHLAHFVFSSVLNTQLSKILNHGRKAPVEEHLMESAIPYTILQPGHFMENSMSMLISQKDAPNITFPAMYPEQVGHSFLSLDDLAEASFKVIKERSRHFYALYQLVSTGPCPYSEYVEIVGKVLGKKIQIKLIPYPENVNMVCNFIFGTRDPDQSYRDAPERMLLWYEKRALVGNPNVLEWLLGRPPTSVEQLARKHLQAAIGEA